MNYKISKELKQINSANIPSAVKEYFAKFCLAQGKEDRLYAIADLISSWAVSASSEHHQLVAIFLCSIPLQSSRVLIAALSDASFTTENLELIDCIASFLKSNDRRLAQTATVFLVLCGGDAGTKLLNQTIKSEHLPCLPLVCGIKDLLELNPAIACSILH